ncbi:MAG: alpha/beta hydrolase [Planctomycetes bacterium]|nr:alpha/beta hydrolase [Planctomycetota bacterium]
MSRLAPRLIPCLLLLLAVAAPASAMRITKDVPYATPALERQVLDIYAPDDVGQKKLPVVFWIHGGGWQQGDKSDVALKPAFFVERGFVFVSTNYRLYPHVEMGELIRDVARSLGWVHKHIAEHGGDPSRILVGGHSAGAQLAAIIATDDRYLKAEGVPFAALRGCIPVDGDTYYLPAIIAVAELRAYMHGLPMPGKSGHRVKFGNDPEKHLDFSAVTHVAKGKDIPPFFIMFVSGHPDTSAQARRLAMALESAAIPVRLYGGRETTHSKLNNDIGLADDLGTKALVEFVNGVLK